MFELLKHDVVQEGPASRKQLGGGPQELAIYEDLSATENLMYWGAAYGLRGTPLRSQVNEVLSTIGQLDRAKEPVKNFSAVPHVVALIVAALIVGWIGAKRFRFGRS